MLPMPPSATAQLDARDLLRRISDRWTLLIGVQLAAGPRRFGELAKAVDGISKKMLAQTLRNLERDGLVARTVIPSMPVTVEYALTPLGATLTAPIQALTTWTDTHMAEVGAARRRYDGERKRVQDDDV